MYSQVSPEHPRLDGQPRISKISRLVPNPGSAMLLRGCLIFPFHRLGWSSRLSTKDQVRGFPRLGQFCPVGSISRLRGLVLAADPSNVKDNTLQIPGALGSLRMEEHPSHLFSRFIWHSFWIDVQFSRLGRSSQVGHIPRLSSGGISSRL